VPEEHVPVLSFFWGDPAPYVERAHRAGARVIHRWVRYRGCGTGAASGVGRDYRPGFEAGGHVAGNVSTLALVPRVVDAVAPVPVAAAARHRRCARDRGALALGAQAGVLGTRFLATFGANAHPIYKDRCSPHRKRTRYTRFCSVRLATRPHRTLRTQFVEEWLPNFARGQESRPDEPVIGHTRVAGHDIPVPRVHWAFPPSSGASGDIESMSLLAGQGVGLVERTETGGRGGARTGGRG